MAKHVFRLVAGSMIAAAFVSQAAAHGGHSESIGFPTGMLHPLTGWDHLMAALAVGAFAARLRNGASLGVTAAFATALGGGFALSRTSIALPLLEPMILASIVGIGAMAVAAERLKFPPAIAALACFGVFHGYAHGAGAGAHATTGFLIGVIASTCVLIAFAAAAFRHTPFRRLASD